MVRSSNTLKVSVVRSSLLVLVDLSGGFLWILRILRWLTSGFNGILAVVDWGTRECGAIDESCEVSLTRYAILLRWNLRVDSDLTMSNSWFLRCFSSHILSRLVWVSLPTSNTGVSWVTRWVIAPRVTFLRRSKQTRTYKQGEQSEGIAMSSANNTHQATQDALRQANTVNARDQGVNYSRCRGILFLGLLTLDIVFLQVGVTILQMKPSSYLGRFLIVQHLMSSNYGDSAGRAIL